VVDSPTMVEEVGRNISEVVVRSGLILEEVDESPARSSHVVEEVGGMTQRYL
ncbi:hypothetical protein V6N11_021379, partial [Hibiscus sabdariffa]